MASVPFIPPADVPAALIEAAERALAAEHRAEPDTTVRQAIRVVLATVLPIHEQQLRQKIARQVQFPTRVVFADSAEEAQAILDRERRTDGTG